VVATNNTNSSCGAVELSGSGKPKLSADGVGVVPSEAVSANSAPLPSRKNCIIKEVDVALEVAVPAGEGDSSDLCVSCSHGTFNLGQQERVRENIVDRRHDRLR